MAEVPENNKKYVIVALEASKFFCSSSYDDFSIDTIGSKPKLTSAAGGLENVFQGKLKIKTKDDDKDFETLAVAALE